MRLSWTTPSSSASREDARCQVAVSSSARVARVVERVGAVHAAQRAPIRQLGDERVGAERLGLIRRRGPGRARSWRVEQARSPRARRPAPRWPYRRASARRWTPPCRSPVQSWRTSAAVVFEHEAALRIQEHVARRLAVEAQPRLAGAAGAGSRRDHVAGGPVGPSPGRCRRRTCSPAGARGSPSCG